MVAFRKLSFLIIFQFPFLVLAHYEGWGNWIMYFGQNRVSDKISIHSEAQYRNHTLVPGEIEQLLLRTGLNYHFSPSIFASAGYGHISSYIYESEQSAPESIEHRIWQQLIINSGTGRIKTEHRYRTEQRWIESKYKNRIRYRLNALLALNNPDFRPGSFFLSFYDEIFLNTQQTFFDRNRLYAGFGYQISKIANVQTGVLHQQVNDYSKWHLQFGLVFNPDLRSSD